MNKKHVAEAAAWLREERQRLDWSLDRLVEEVHNMAADFRWEGVLPDIGAIEQLEAERLPYLPRWFKLICYAIEVADLPDNEYMAWLAERNHHWQHNRIVRLSRPILFEDEWRFIAALDRFDEDSRRALRAFVTNYATRQCYETKEVMAERFLKKLGIKLAVLDGDD